MRIKNETRRGRVTKCEMEDQKQKGDGYQTTRLPRIEPDKEKDGEQRKVDEEEHQEADNILEHAIEYCMTGSYPPALTKDKKRAVRRELKL